MKPTISYGDAMNAMNTIPTSSSQKRESPLRVLFIAFKAAQGAVLFAAYDLLVSSHGLSLSTFLLLVMTLAAVALNASQRHNSAIHHSLSSRKWLLRIVSHAVLLLMSWTAWVYGLRHCGALRTVLLSQYSDVIIVGIASICYAAGPSPPSRVRGSVAAIFGLVFMLLFDHLPQSHKESMDDSLNSVDVSANDTPWVVSDKTLGMFALFFSACISIIHKNQARHLMADVGGSKTLRSLSYMLAAIIMVPVTIVHSIFCVSFSTVNSSISTTDDSSNYVFWNFVSLCTLAALLIVGDIYMDIVANTRFSEPSAVPAIGYVAAWSGALVWEYVCKDSATITGTLLFSSLALCFALFQLSNPTSNVHGGGHGSIKKSSFGLRPQTLDVYDSMLNSSRNILRQVLENYDSRQIFYFLSINLTFMVVEFTYGIWTNSLGLISDGFHMLFDCTALAVGLFAAVISQRKRTPTFTYGFGRVEVLSGYINAVFLVLISFFVFSEAVARIREPQEVSTDRLLLVSIAGFGVNMIGIFAFSHAHSHGGKKCDGAHGHDSHHGHSHEHHSSHGHSHDALGAPPVKPQSSANMRGVFLHILADTLGSVGVIISSFLIQQFGWQIADPICSIFIAVLIFISVLPLLSEATAILLQRTPSDFEEMLKYTLTQVSLIDGVMGYSRPQFWEHANGSLVGTLHVEVVPDTNERAVQARVAGLFKAAGVSNFTLQIAKEEFFRKAHGHVPTTTITML